MTTTDLRIAVVGCGNISLACMRNAALFGGVRITACADQRPVAAGIRMRGNRHVRGLMGCFRHSNPPIELHGTNGSLRLPDPDTFGGVVAVSAGETGGAQVIASSTAQPRELREDEAARLRT